MHVQKTKKKTKKKKWLVTAGCLQQLEKAGCKWLSSKKKKKKKGEKKKSCVNRLLCLLYPFMGSMYQIIICAFLQDYTVSH